MKAVKKRVADRNTRDLLWKFLRAGVMHQDTLEETLTGTPQGASLHFLQSGKHGARVLDEYSAETTAPQLWGRVSGRPAPRGTA